MKEKSRPERLARKIMMAEQISYPEAMEKAQQLIQERQPEQIRNNVSAKRRATAKNGGKLNRYRKGK